MFGWHPGSRRLLAALDGHEELVEVPRIAEAALSALQRARVLTTELPAPLTDRLVGDGDAALCQEILDVSEAQAEPVIQPDGMTDDLGWEAMASVAGCAVVHEPTLAALGSS